LINFVDATNDANHYTKPSPIDQSTEYVHELLLDRGAGSF